MSLGAAKAAASQAAVVTYNVFITPSSILEFGVNGARTSIAATANVTGGNPPLTFTWSRVSGDNFAINSPSSQSTTFSASGNDETKSGVYKVIVTDSSIPTPVQVEDQFNVEFQFFGLE